MLLLTALAMMVSISWAQGPNGSGTYYKNASGQQGANLKTALSKIINPHTNIGYDGLFKAYEQTDKRADGKVRDWYSCTTNYNFSDHGGYKKEGDCYNREHTVPQSWFGGGVIKSDVVHVVPTDGYVNNRRSAYPFGEVSNATYQSNQGYCKLGSCKTAGYSGTVFEPNQEIKGDIARIYFYMMTCYESVCSSWGHNVFSSQNLGFERWALDMLMRWAKEDPVDARETARNNAVYATQKNRNPFVDYPGLEDYIWGDKTGFKYDDYNGGGGEAVPTVAMPVFTPDAGSYYSQVEITLSCATDGAVIYYTTNGADPSVQSMKYEGPFTLAETSTVKAVAVKDDVVSYQASAFYQIKSEDEGDDEGDDVTPADGTIQFCDQLFGTGYAGSLKSSDTDDLVGTKDGVKVVYALAEGSNRYVNSSQLRLYPGNKLTISVQQGMLTELEFQFAENTPSTNLEVAGQSLADGKWTGSAQSVTIELGTGKHARLSAVKVKTTGTSGVESIKASDLSGRRVVYNLRGQRVAHPQRGMYIVDGKKVMVE